MNRNFVRAVIRYHFAAFVWLGIAVGALLWGVFATYHQLHVGRGPFALNCGSVAHPSGEMAPCAQSLRNTQLVRAVCMSVGAMACVRLAVIVVGLFRRPPALATGGHVHLRATSVRDARSVVATMDEVVLAENRMTVADQTLRKQYVRWFRGAADLAICDNATGELVGVVSATNLPSNDGAVMGIWLGAPHRGRGWAAEAVTLLVSVLHGKGVQRVIAETSQENIAMQSSLSRARFHRIGVVPHVFNNGETIDAQRYEWTAPVSGAEVG